MIKLSEKAKIILAVMAVVVVAAGAVTFTALSVNSNDGQGSLSADNNGEPAVVDTLGVTITSDFSNGEEYDGRAWSADIDNAPVIGMYNVESDGVFSVEKDIISNVVGGDGFERIQSVSGKTFDGTDIDENTIIYDDTSITVTKAGIYTAVAVINGEEVGLYAKVAKNQLTPFIRNSGGNVYTGSFSDPIMFEVRADENQKFDLGSVIDYQSIEIKGYDCKGGTIEDGIDTSAVEYYQALFTVVYAGRYEISFTIIDSAQDGESEKPSDNYEWAENPNSLTATVEFTVKQALVAPQAGTSGTWLNTGNEDGSISYLPTLTVDDIKGKLNFKPTIDANNNQNGKYKLEYQIYTDADFEHLAQKSDLAPGVTLYAKAVNLLPYSSGDKTYLNYRLPEQSEDGFKYITCAIEIAAPSLPRASANLSYYINNPDGIDFPGGDYIPTMAGNTISVHYLNYGYKISQWFYSGNENKWNLPIEQDGHDSGKNWIVTVNGEKVDPDTFEMKNAGTYEINIKPKQGYKFAGDTAEYNYKLIISPYELTGTDINWLDRKDRVYTGQGIPFGENDYELNLPTILSADNNKLTLTFECTDTTIADGVAVPIGTPVDAGHYHYKVKSIGGASADNFVLQSEGVTNVGHLYTIYRKQLSDFSGTPIATYQFNGSLQTEDLESYLIEKGLAEWRVDSEGDNIFAPFMLRVQNVPIIRTLNGKTYNNDAQIDRDQFFKFTYAGSYSVTFSLTTEFAVNYCWAGGDINPGGTNVNYTWNNFIVVEQAEFDPTLPKTNISVNDEYDDLANTFNGFVNGGTTAVYELKYGVVGSDVTSSTPQDKDGSKYKEGQYYVLIVIKDEFAGSCVFKQPLDGEYTVSPDGKTARMEYVVSSSAVSVTVNVKPYTFGDNILGSLGISDVFTVTKNPAEGVTYGGVTYKFYTDLQRTEPVADADLINGLPRNAGTYYVKVIVDYTLTTDGTTENLTYTRNCELTVAKRSITLQWSLDGTPTVNTSANFTYNGNTHTVTVAAVVADGLPAVNVTLDGSDAQNAGTYVFAVQGLSGAEAGNYTYESATNTSFTITIDRAQVTVTANNVANLTIGEQLILNGYKVDGEFFNNDGENKLSLAVYSVSSNGQLSLVDPSNYSSLARGSYIVVPVWEGEDVPSTITDNKYVVTLTNYTVTMVADSFSVSSQTLEITLYGGTQVPYGDDINLYIPRVDGSGIYSLNLDLSADELKDIVEIYLTTESGGAVTPNSDGKINAGKYRLRARSINDDYSLSVKYINESGQVKMYATFEVTPIEVTIYAKDILNHRYGEGYDSGYSGYTPENALDSSISVICRTYSYEKSHTEQIWANMAPAGEYLHFAVVANKEPATIYEDSDGRYYYLVNSGNYRIKSVAGKFIIKPTALTIEFTNAGSAVYGDAINLWAQRTDLSDDAQRWLFEYFEARSLQYLQDKLKDLVTVCLVDGEGNELDPSTDKIGATEYQFKFKLKEGASYVLNDGTQDVDELVGGTFTVSPKAITVTLNVNKTTTVYGDSLTDAGITLNYTVASGALIAGDDLGGSVGIYNSSNELITDISKQNVGTSYYAGFDWTNKNYAVTYTKVSFKVVQRTVTVTANDVTSHTYGESFDVSSITWQTATANGHGDAVVNGDNLDIVAKVYSGSSEVTDFTKLTVKDGGYTITLAQGANANANYKVTLVGGKFTVTKRAITIAAQDVTNHIYGSGLTDNELKYEVTSTLGIVNGDDLNIVLAVFDGVNDVTDNVASLVVGNYTIKVSASNPNYEISVENAEFKIIELQVTITFNAGASSVYGEEVNLNDAFTVVGLIGDDKAVVTAKNDSGVAASNKASVGTYHVEVTLSNPNYKVTYVNGDANHRGTYTIEKRTVKIVPQNVNHVYGNELGNNELGYGFAYVCDTASPYTVIDGDDIGISVNIYASNSIVTNVALLDVIDGGYIMTLSCDNSNGNYKVDYGGEAKFVVTPRELTLTFTANGSSSVYGDFTNADLYSESVGTLTNAVNGHVYNNIVNLVLKQADTIPVVAEYEIEAALNDGYKANYTLKVVGAGKYSITQRTVVLNVSKNFSELAYGDSLPANPFSYKADGTGFVNQADEDSLNIKARVYNGQTDVTDSISTQVKGTYTVGLEFTANSNYIIKVNTITLEISLRSITVAFNGGGTSDYGEQVNLYTQQVVDITNANNYLVNGHTFADVIALTATKDGIAMASSNPSAGRYTVNAAIKSDYADKYKLNLVSPVEGVYTVAPRSITITPNNVTNVYGDVLGNKLDNAYTVTGSYAGSAIVAGDDLAITLSIFDGGNKIDIANIPTLGYKDGGYTIKVSYDTTNGNYTVDGTATSVFTVSKRDITIKYINDKTSVYGETAQAAEQLYQVVDGELKNGDVFDITVLNGASEDAYAVNANAGVYTVTVSASDNYAIAYDNGQTGTYTIEKRVISVTNTNPTMQFTPLEGDEYQTAQGAYGKAHNAVLQFTNTVGDIASSEYTITYNTTTGAGQTAGYAPVKAGNYTVTVTLASNGNYAFAGASDGETTNTAELDFTVTKIKFDSTDVRWSETSITIKKDDDSAESKENVLDGFDRFIMDVQIERVLVVDGSKQTVTPTFDDNNILRLTVSGQSSTFFATITLKSSATDNYEFNVEKFIQKFTLTNNVITFLAKQDNAQYSDSLNDYAFKIFVNGDEWKFNQAGAEGELSVMYGKVVGEDDIDKAKAFMEDPEYANGVELKRIESLFDVKFILKQDLPEDFFDIGYYILCVKYDGNVSDGNGQSESLVVRGCNVFEITKKELDIPAFESTTYNGQQQTLVVKYDNEINGVALNTIIRAVYNGNAIGSGSQITGTNAGNYEVHFVIRDGYETRYCWTGGTISDKQVEWTIQTDSAENIDNKYFSVSDITETYGNAIVEQQITPLQGYDGKFTWQYTTRRSGETVAPESGWSGDVPNYAGHFWIKVTLTDDSGHNNFTSKVAYAKLTIDKATLTLTPNGTITYGDAFDPNNGQNKYSFELSGFVYDQNKSVVTGNVTYALVGNIDGTKLDANANGYGLTVEVENGYVKGLTAENYNIVVAEGKLIVDKRAVNVSISSVNDRQYGWTIDLSTVSATSDDVFAQDEVIGNITFKTDANQSSPVGGYRIYTEYSDPNFIITYTNGTYTIIERKVTVTLTNGGGTYNGTITPVTFNATVVDQDGVETALDSSANFVITVLYDGSSTVPHNANNYAVTISANGNSNYVLANSPTLTFTIEKFAVDSRKISTQNKVFTGVAIEPQIIIADDADFTYDVFSVTSGYQDFIDVGDHYKVTLTLTDADNYKWLDVNGDAIEDADIQINFTIDPAGIFAIPYGSITYGTAATDETIKWKFVYALSGQTVPDGIVRLNGDGVQIIFVGEINRERPVANTYKVTLKTDDSGRVIGFESDNYNISLKTDGNGEVVYGDYVVKKKQITIVAGSSTSIYSQTPADFLSNTFTLKVGESLAWDDEIDVIKNYTPSIDATASSNVGKYDVTATVEADNYKVTVEIGTHEILPIKVKVDLTATDGVYHGTNAAYSVSSISATNLTGYVFESGFQNRLIYKVTGTQNDGTSYESLTGVIPQNAGSYSVTASLDNANDNFEIDVVNDATFDIAKKVIDESGISIGSKVYSGTAQSHGLSDNDGYTVSNQTFTVAGSHTVTLTLVNTYNYAWKNTAGNTVDKTFVITKANLTLTPYGTITYGESFANSTSKFGFELKGLRGDDEGKANDEIVSGIVKYLLGDGVDGTKLTVQDGGYVMYADISGIECDNYTVHAAAGKLTVNKRAITIRPVGSESVYGEKVILSQQFEVVKGTLANGDDNSVITYLAVTTANETSDADSYGITATAQNANYEITVLNGTHTINKAKVGVRIRPINGTYGESAARIEFMTVVVIKSDGTVEAVKNLQFNVNYSGTAYDGTTFNGSVVPSKAGIYEATVTGVVSKNYELDRTYSSGIYSTILEVFKREIDADKIKAKTASYTGKAIIPEIDDKFYNAEGQTKIYNTIFTGSLINVGIYDLTLSLIDINNYAWVDNLNRTTTIKFEIVKADNSLVDKDNPNAPADSIKVEISDWTFGETVSAPKASVISGEQNIVFEYATSENGSYTTEVPHNAGEYWVRATVAASDNYNAFVSRATKFVISKKTVNAPAVTNLNENSVYTGSMLSLIINGFDDQIMSLTLDDDMYRSDNNGQLNLLALNANTYKAVFKLRNSNNYQWSDTADVVDGAIVVNWTVERQVVKRIPDATNKLIVNGEDIIFIPEGFNSGIMTIENNVHAHEGYYSAVITLKDTDNYVWEDTESASITVNFELTGTNTAFIAAICVVSGLCVGLAVMAVILTLVNRRKKRKEAQAIDERSRADGWEGE